MPLAFTSEPATVGEASRPLAAPFWAGSAPRTPTKSDADADADTNGPDPWDDGCRSRSPARAR